MKTALILGAGIIGLSTALELADQGIDVTVLERSTAMAEASWAAAGMLAALDPENPAALRPFSQLSVALYPAYLRRVAQLSGLPVPIRTSHTLQYLPALRPRSSGADAGSRLYESSAAARSPEDLTPDQAGMRVPGLGTGRTGRFLWLDEESLDPRDLCRALPVAARAAGVHIVEQAPVSSIQCGRHGFSAATDQQTWTADSLVVCAGAWSGTLLSMLAKMSRMEDSLDIDQKDSSGFLAGSTIQPLKGQMIAVQQQPQAMALESVIRSPAIYLVPRGHGRILIGATVENAGFDRTVHASSTAWLLDQAAALWPPIRAARIEAAWTGLRPGTRDGLPLLGPAGHPRLWIASGHYRNGILLAPATAHLVSRSLLQPESAPESAPALDLTPFLPTRFAHALTVIKSATACVDANS